MSRLFYRDFVQKAGSQEEPSFCISTEHRAAFIQGQLYLLALSFEFFAHGSEDDPVWSCDNDMHWCDWRRKEGLRFEWVKPFYDTDELIANPDESIKSNYSHLLNSCRPGHIPIEMLKGIRNSSAPEEYTLIHAMTKRALIEYQSCGAPWLLAWEDWTNFKGKSLFISRTSGLMIALKLMEMAFNDDEDFCEFDSVLSFYKVRGSAPWRDLTTDDIWARLERETGKKRPFV